MADVIEQEHGFTLIEVLVAMGMSMVVLIALTMILTTTISATQRTFTQVDATRQARSAVATIDNEMHSACVDSGATPIQPGSSAQTVNFISYTGGASTPGATASNPVLYHKLTLSAGALTDTTYAATEANGAWVPGAQQNVVTLLTRAVVQTGESPFEYYAYAPYNAPDGNQYWTIPNGVNALPNGVVPANAPITPGGSGLSSADAQTIVEVVVNLKAEAEGQGDNSDLASTADPVTDAISLRLSTPPNEEASGAGSGEYGPCE